MFYTQSHITFVFLLPSIFHDAFIHYYHLAYINCSCSRTSKPPFIFIPRRTVLTYLQWLEEPDTGLVNYLASTNYTEGSLPLLKDIRAAPDFDWAAEAHLGNQQYAFYRTAAAGEWSYRNNLDIWSKIKFRTRMLNDVSKLNETLP